MIDILKDRDVIKSRVKGTEKSIHIKLADVNVTDLASDLFVHTTDPIAKEFIKLIESQLILAVVDPVRFDRTLLKFFRSLAEFIRRKKLYKQYFDFCYFIYSEYEQKNIDKNIFGAYMDILQQLFTQLHPDMQTIVYGTGSDGNLYLCTEFYPLLEYPLIKYDKKYCNDPRGAVNNLGSLFKDFHKLGYNVSNLNELEMYISNERLVGNEIFMLARFINESTLDIFPSPSFAPGGGLPEELKLCKLPSEIFKEKLYDKKYSLPFSGVVGRYKNVPNIKEVLFKERIIYDDLNAVLLFKITMYDNTYLSGFYDNKTKLFWTCYKDSDGVKYHEDIELFILQSYYYLTCKLDDDLMQGLFILNKTAAPISSKVPCVEFIFNEVCESSVNRVRQYNAEDYLPVLTEVSPYIRRLPYGQKASDEARKRALEMGYVLQEGETFVRPHTKTVHRRD